MFNTFISTFDSFLVPLSLWILPFMATKGFPLKCYHLTFPKGPSFSELFEAIQLITASPFAEKQ